MHDARPNAAFEEWSKFEIRDSKRQIIAWWATGVCRHHIEGAHFPGNRGHDHMISYCIAAYRPNYVRLLLADLVAKTSVPFEILLWLNVADSALDTDIETAINKGVPLRVIGRTPENIGMVAFSSLFRSARFPLITQIDDDVVFISRGIAERASRLFQRFPAVSQLVDEYTTGARPPMDRYEPFEASEGL